MEPVGIFGGTFDPVHFGHLRVALELKEHLGLQAMLLLPCHVPPHRGDPHASAEQREAMLRMATADEPALTLDRRELERSGPSYMVDTLTSLREEYGSERPLCLIIGGDAFASLPSWYHWQELIELAHIVVAHRPGWQVEQATLDVQLQDLMQRHRLSSPDELALRPAGGLLMQAVTQLDISATGIRQLVAAGKSANYLLPQNVWNFIQQQKLYC